MFRKILIALALLLALASTSFAYPPGYRPTPYYQAYRQPVYRPYYQPYMYRPYYYQPTNYYYWYWYTW